jgi:hypothetical protein
MKDTRTGAIFKTGELCFALISYFDDNGNYHFVNEEQYFIRI